MKTKMFITLFFPLISFAQVGIGTDNPEAILDVRERDPANPENSAGISVPHVNSLPTSGNRAGQLVILTTSNNYYYYDGVRWTCVNCNTNFAGDIKYDFTEQDHDGWFMLNGRRINSLGLNNSQQSNASSLGFTNRLPNATNRILKNRGNVGNTGGGNTITIAQANLPNVNFTATSTANAGQHRHSYQDRTRDRSGQRDSRGNLREHNDGVQNISRTTGSSGNHNHTVSVSSGGSGVAVDIENRYLNINVFIYLGE